MDYQNRSRAKFEEQQKDLEFYRAKFEEQQKDLEFYFILLLLNKKVRGTEKTYIRASMKDYKLKLRDLPASHALGCVRDWNT